MQGQSQLEARNAEPVYAGIDVCKDRLDVHLHPLGERFAVTNDPAGFRALARRLAGRELACVVLEATGKFHRPVHRALSRDGFSVAVLNPRRARLFAEAAGTQAKTDRVDARMLAVFGQALAPRVTPPAPQALEDLQEIVHARDAARTERTALANRRGASTTPFLQRELSRRLDSLDHHIARLDAEIDRRIAADTGLARRRDILRSIPSVGPAVAAALIADLPELGQLDRHAAASLAGLAPVPDDSANTSGPRHIRGGRPSPRRALYWAALSAARHNPDLAAFYRRLRANGKKPKVALTAVMRKLVILANTLLGEDRTWVNHHA